MGQGWGRGQYNAAADLWEWYEFPKDHPAVNPNKGWTWVQILGQWRWLVADFARFYRVNVLRSDESWVWFKHCVVGLLSLPDSLLRLALVSADKGDG